MLQLRQIAEGYINLAKNSINISNDTIEELSKQRMLICTPCESLKDNSCSFCGCYMPAKTRVLDAVCGDKENPKW